MSKADRDQDRPVSIAGSEPPADPDLQGTAQAHRDQDEHDQNEQDEENGGAPSADIQSYIGVQLRAVYDGVAQQPIPDRFLDLMKRLG